MTILQLIHRIGRRARGGDFTKLSLPEQEDILEAANSAMQQCYLALPMYFKEMTVGLNLQAPVTLTGIGVTNNSATITGGNFTSAQYGQSIQLDGDAQTNQIIGANTLLNPYNGTTATVGGTTWGDAIYSTRLPFDRIIGNPQFTDESTFPMVQRSMARSDFPFYGMISSIGRPQFWWTQPFGNSQGQTPLIFLRFWPRPDKVYPISIRMGFWPKRFSFTDLDAATTIPVPDQFIDGALVPIGLRAFLTSPAFGDKSDSEIIFKAAERGDAMLAMQPGQVGAPANRIFTPVGY